MLNVEPEALKLAAYCDLEDAFERACSRELRKLYIEKQDLLNALRDLVAVTRHLDPCPATLEAALTVINNVTSKE